MYIKLREIRKEHGYTVQQMADFIGISKPYYSQLETDKRNISYNLAVKISGVFKMKPDEIFYEDFLKRK